jgi:hypothetical protein
LRHPSHDKYMPPGSPPGAPAVVVGDPDARRLIEPLARQDPKAAGQMFPESLRSLYALTLHRQGDTRRAAELWRESDAAAHRSPEAGAEGFAAPMELAAINAIQGHTDAALEWLERGYRAGWKDARFLSFDPFFASVRREPRYLALTTGMTQDVAEMRKRTALIESPEFTRPAHPCCRIARSSIVVLVEARYSPSWRPH